jgi:acyl carrier protein
LNEDKRLQPIGLAGELYIAGIGLARGYLNNDRLTKEKFVDNSVESAGNPFEAATKMYKTGDLARWLPDGNIEYLGRIDRQIKIRGFRIELEEIEEALKNYDTIHRSVVTIDKQKDFLGHEQLKAFYIAKDGQEISQQIIRDFLLQKLPEYMVPAIFERVESFPLTGHGKVDVKTLLKNSHVKSAGSLPGTKFDFGTTDQKRIKQIVKAVYRQVLDKEEIDPFTNFFDLGGHSLLMVKAGMLLNEKLQAEINTVELFNYPTISSLSNYLILKLLEKPSTHANHEESHPAGDELSLVKSRDRGKKQRDFLLKRNK